MLPGLFLFASAVHCLKSVRMRSYSGPHFTAFGLNTVRYFVSLHIQSKCGKMGTRITPHIDTVSAVVLHKLETNYSDFFMLFLD